MIRNWDLTNLSTADERQLGAELHDVIVALNPVATDGPWLQRVEAVAKPLQADSPSERRSVTRSQFWIATR